MIKSFRDRETEKIWNQETSRKLPENIQQAALRKLFMLSRSRVLEDLRIPPGKQLGELKRDREGQYSIKVNDQWRICFEWIDGESCNVEIVDYH